MIKTHNLFVIIIFILTMGYIYHIESSKEVKKEQVIDFTELEAFQHEIKKCYLKKYCLINKSRLHKDILRLSKEKTSKEKEDCFLNKDCTENNKIHIITLVRNQSPKMNRFYSYLNNNICSPVKKAEYYNYFNNLIYMANIFNKEEKIKMYRNIKLENMIKDIKEEITNCSRLAK